MHRTALLSLLGLWCVLAGTLGQSHARPNLVLILADDLGWCDTSQGLTNLGHPSDFYETPAIDRLAAAGMAFTNAYANGPNCAPTRAAILTGQYAARQTNNVFTVQHLNRAPGNQLLVGPTQGLPTGTDAIPTAAFTYAEMLQQAGYESAHFGKFHVTECGDDGAALITSDHGFNHNFGGACNGAPGAYHATQGVFHTSIGPALDRFAGPYTQTYVDKHIKPFTTGVSHDAVDALVGSDKHVSDALADAAIEFMEQAKAGPFCVQFNPYAVHTPIGAQHARYDLLKKYRAKSPGAKDSNAPFAALIEGLDQSVARIVDYLTSTPDPNHPGESLADNTVVVFFSDNGGKLNQSNNGPLRGQKGELWEGGIRVPMIAWSENHAIVHGGTVNPTPVIGIDLFPTFARLAGANLPEDIVLDGVDLSTIFADASAKLDRDAIFWHFPGYLIKSGRNQRPQSVIRSGDWKLAYRYEDQRYSLHNLASDISEDRDLTAEHPEVVAQLGEKLLRWLAETRAPLATLRMGALTIDAGRMQYAEGSIGQRQGHCTLEAGDEAPFVLPHSNWNVE